MAESIRDVQSSSSKLVLLIQERNSVKEGSMLWHNINLQVDRIIAQNYLEYINR
jgi:hypothetical protein